MPACCILLREIMVPLQVARLREPHVFPLWRLARLPVRRRPSRATRRARIRGAMVLRFERALDTHERHPTALRTFPTQHLEQYRPSLLSTCGRHVLSAEYARMPDRTACPRCMKVGFVRHEKVIRAGRAERHYECGHCNHSWAVADQDKPAVSRPPTPERSRRHDT